jgi:hypothetical protein
MAFHVREELLDAEDLADDLRLLVDLVGERLELLSFLVLFLIRRHVLLLLLVVLLLLFVVIIVVVAIVARGGAAEALIVLRIGVGAVILAVALARTGRA